jgi:hypothetical protein
MVGLGMVRQKTVASKKDAEAAPTERRAADVEQGHQ